MKNISYNNSSNRNKIKFKGEVNMKEYVYEGKDQEVVLKKVLEDLNVTENDFVYTKEEVKGKLFKAGTTKYHVYLNTDMGNAFMAQLLADQQPNSA